MNELIIGMVVAFVVIVVAVCAVTYVVCSFKTLSVLNRLMDWYEPVMDKLKDYVDDNM